MVERAVVAPHIHTLLLQKLSTDSEVKQPSGASSYFLPKVHQHQTLHYAWSQGRTGEVLGYKQHVGSKEGKGGLDVTSFVM